MQACIGVLVLAGALGGQSSSAADLPSLFVFFQKDRTFALSLADGTSVGTSSAPGTVIPAGTYRVNVDDTAQAVMQFHLTGPGVELITNMTFGEDAAQTLVETFQPNSTYTFRDDYQPNVVRFFSTSSTSISSGGSGGGAPTASTPTKSQSSGASPVTSQDIVGSGVVSFRGTLAATVSAAGKLTLTTKGKPVSTLKAGLYTFTVHDNSPRRGFSIQKVKTGAIDLTGVGYKGIHVKTVNLKVGQWMFYSPAGTKQYFIVVR
jgi:hypothetical protein